MAARVTGYGQHVERRGRRVERHARAARERMRDYADRLVGRAVHGQWHIGRLAILQCRDAADMVGVMVRE
ncbi:hypothetical protein FEP81_05590 [Burkholderia multivorans]|nr:hypothetical protein [Burkholderia multivorans]